MQFKPVPAPPTDGDPVAALDAVRRALPPEPDPSLDCCARVIERTHVETRPEASDWLVFLRALELAVDERDGYHRVPDDEPPDPRRLADAFCKRVADAGDVVDAVDGASESIAAEDVFAELDASDAIPRSARRRHGNRLSERLADRIDRILSWAVAFALVERAEDGYRPAGE